jgi:hypothetical protein
MFERLGQTWRYSCCECNIFDLVGRSCGRTDALWMFSRIYATLNLFINLRFRKLSEDYFRYSSMIGEVLRLESVEPAACRFVLRWIIHNGGSVQSAGFGIALYVCCICYTLNIIRTLGKLVSADVQSSQTTSPSQHASARWIAAVYVFWPPLLATCGFDLVIDGWYLVCG